MKSVLMSIRPKWCELIASGKKTIEVRKAKPKIEGAFKVYIYQTKGKWIYKLLERLGFSQGKVIGEFVCDEIHTGKAETIKEAVCLYYGIEEQSCLSEYEFANYWNGKNLYAWHISDLKIYDKPKGLYEFKQCHKCPYGDYENCREHGFSCNGEYNLTRPPQSYCYCEEVSI